MSISVTNCRLSVLLLRALPPAEAQRGKSVFWIRNNRKKKSIIKGNEVDEINMLLLFGAFSSELRSSRVMAERSAAVS